MVMMTYLNQLAAVWAEAGKQTLRLVDDVTAHRQIRGAALSPIRR